MKELRFGVMVKHRYKGSALYGETFTEWHVSFCPFCGKPVRGEEWLDGSHLCKGLKEAIDDLKKRGILK